MGIQASEASTWKIRHRAISKRKIYPYIIAVSDAVTIAIAFTLAYQLRHFLEGLHPSALAALPNYVGSASLLGGIALICFWVAGHYDFGKSRASSLVEVLYGIFAGISISVVLTLTLTYMIQSYANSRALFIFVWAIGIALLSFSRLTMSASMGLLRQKGFGAERIAIVGTNKVGTAVYESMEKQPWLGYKVVGFFDERPEKNFFKTSQASLFAGSLKNLKRVLDVDLVHEVVIALQGRRHREILEVMQECQERGVRFSLVPDLYAITLNRMDVKTIGRIPVIGAKETTFESWEQAVKRVLDIAISIVAIVGLAPFLLLAACAIKLDSSGPVLFSQTRVGQSGRTFTLLKFRSMHINAEALIHELRQKNGTDTPTFKMKDDPRITRVGRFIRRTSIDELPQLINVLKGDMSLVGPRPPIPYEVELYEEWQRRRLEVIPGLTGLWQVSGRSKLTFTEMVRLDLYYIDNWSLLLDMKIILRTIPTVLLSQGAM